MTHVEMPPHVRRLVLVLALASGCGGAAASSATAARPNATSALPDRAALDAIVDEAETARGLRLPAGIDFRLVTRETLGERLRDSASPETKRRSRAVIEALGLAAPNADVDEQLGTFYANEAVGAYLPAERRVLLRADRVDALADQTNAGEGQRLVVLHEVVHALQHALLMPDMGAPAPSTDVALARRSVYEGDANFAMIVALALRVGADPALVARNPEGLRTFAGMMLRESVRDPTGRRRTSGLRVEFMTPYYAGASFVADRYAEGGWPAVDALYAQRPESSEQVLHPELYATGHHPEPIAIPRVPVLDAAGYETVTEDTFGELELQVYFAPAQLPDRGVAAAEGWGGDRIRVYRAPDGHLASIWLQSWDTVRDAVEAAEAARLVGPRLIGGTRVPHEVRRLHRFVLVVHGLTGEPLAAALQALDEFVTAGRLDPVAWRGSAPR